MTLLLTVALDVPFGVLTSLRAKPLLDHALFASLLLLLVMPEFVVFTVLLIIFIVQLGSFRQLLWCRSVIKSRAHPNLLILPVVTATLLVAADVAQMLRALSFSTALAAFTSRRTTLAGLSRYIVACRHFLT